MLITSTFSLGLVEQLTLNPVGPGFESLKVHCRLKGLTEFSVEVFYSKLNFPLITIYSKNKPETKKKDFTKDML